MKKFLITISLFCNVLLFGTQISVVGEVFTATW
jgi:hypothetical protein